jgi:hypothetical protein
MRASIDAGHARRKHQCWTSQAQTRRQVGSLSGLRWCWQAPLLLSSLLQLLQLRGGG